MNTNFKNKQYVTPTCLPVDKQARSLLIEEGNFDSLFTTNTLLGVVVKRNIIYLYKQIGYKND